MSFNTETYNAQPNNGLPPSDYKINNVKREIYLTKNVMNENINKLLQRNERLNILVEKTDDLKNNSVDFRTNARTLKRTFCCNNFKMWIAIFVVICIIILVIVLSLQPWKKN